MAGRSQMLEIDTNKLREELRRRGLNVTAVSAEMGYNQSYMTHVLKTGSIALPAANQLELRYNIDMDSMKPDAVEKKAPEADPEEVKSLREDVQELTRSVKALTEEFANYKVQMLSYMRDFKNHKKFGHF